MEKISINPFQTIRSIATARTKEYNSEGAELVVIATYSGLVYGYAICYEQFDIRRNLYTYDPVIKFTPHKDDHTYQQVLDDLRTLVADGKTNV